MSFEKSNHNFCKNFLVLPPQNSKLVPDTSGPELVSNLCSRARLSKAELCVSNEM